MVRDLVKVVLLTLVGLAAGTGVLAGSPAHAAAGVEVDNDGRGAVIDARYSSTLTVSGRGFQSVKGGHGGVYVWFGTVGAGWQPSRGGRSGVDYLYVPDSESKDNAGFQQYVAFPGSDTAGAANASMSASGGWSVRLVVPGPTFQAVGRNGAVRTVDCRRVRCGVITVGAHGVRNANNETFTPVSVRDLTPASSGQDGEAGGEEAGVAQSGAEQPDAGSTGAPGASAGEPRALRTTLEVDRRSAVAGRALSFVATGLREGEQFSVVLDDGLVASGPHVAGLGGRATGVIALPPEVAAGTHRLRIFGASRTASVKFGVAAASADAGDAVMKSADPGAAAAGAGWQAEAGPAVAFAVAAGLLFVVALVVALRRMVGGRRAHA